MPVFRGKQGVLVTATTVDKMLLATLRVQVFRKQARCGRDCCIVIVSRLPRDFVRRFFAGACGAQNSIAACIDIYLFLAGPSFVIIQDPAMIAGNLNKRTDRTPQWQHLSNQVSQSIGHHIHILINNVIISRTHPDKNVRGEKRKKRQDTVEEKNNSC